MVFVGRDRIKHSKARLIEALPQPYQRALCAGCALSSEAVPEIHSGKPGCVPIVVDKYDIFSLRPRVAGPSPLQLGRPAAYTPIVGVPRGSGSGAKRV